ncbi:MAG: endonuclease/exonuclease/phosphatase family protein [Bacteroidota bacterium]
MNRLWILLFWIGIFSIVVFYLDFFLVERVPGRPTNSELRIGYVNTYAKVVNEKKVQELIGADCDLWVFLEWTGENFDTVVWQKAGYHLLVNVPRGTKGIALFSKKPFQSTVLYPNIEILDKLPLVKSFVPFRGDTFVLFSLHAPPPIKEWNYSTGIFLSYLDSVIDRTMNLYQEFPLLVVGDFNTMPHQERLTKILEDGLQDAHAVSDFFPGPTWSFTSLIPAFIRIDYILFSGSIKVINVDRFRLPASDHYGLIADFEI